MLLNVLNESSVARMRPSDVALGTVVRCIAFLAHSFFSAAVSLNSE